VVPRGVFFVPLQPLSRIPQAHRVDMTSAWATALAHRGPDARPTNGAPRKARSRRAAAARHGSEGLRHGVSSSSQGLPQGRYRRKRRKCRPSLRYEGVAIRSHHGFTPIWPGCRVVGDRVSGKGMPEWCEAFACPRPRARSDPEVQRSTVGSLTCVVLSKLGRMQPRSC
jgi:hypothetical protein